VLRLESPFFVAGGAVALLEALGEVLAIEATSLGLQGGQALAHAM
jgi:hypothetical protein